jgi:DNA-binding NarL/FixJ family response regulator
MAPLRIVLVDDHEMVLQGLATILGRFLGRSAWSARRWTQTRRRSSPGR